MKFSQVKRMKVPGGSPKRITHDDELLWTNAHEYVSLGDGIAGGHHIDDELQISFAQYGENGRTETEIIGGSYTTLLYDALTKKYKDRFVVSVKSFAQLGETVDSLREKLSHDSVKKALEKASVVTICVGATDLQTPDLPCLSAFTDSDDTTLQNITDQIRSNITLFANNLYILFNQLNEINPRAKYVFTTIYNPYKYLRLSQDVLTSFIWPLLNDIPSEVIEGSPANGSLYKIFITNAYVNFCTRINFLGTWCGMLLAPLNDALHNLVDTYREKHSNILLADISAAWNVVPNRAVNSERYYSDLVHVEYMDITDEDKIPWEALWRGSDKTTYWSNLISKYTISAEEFDFQGFTKELLIQVADKVLGPSISAYPLYYGHDVIHKVFADVLGVQKMPKYTITFKANGGSGLMDAQEVKGINTAPAYVNLNANAFIAETEYHFTGWNTAADGSGTVYKNEQLIGVASDITLYAQWSNICPVNYKHTRKTIWFGDDETGHKECYALYINGEKMPDLGKFSEKISPTYNLPYGTTITVKVDDYVSGSQYKAKDSSVYYNDALVSTGNPAEFTFTLTEPITIDFQWKTAGTLLTFNAQSWEDCHITTNEEV